MEKKVSKKRPQYSKSGKLLRPARRVKDMVPGHAPIFTDPQDMLEAINQYFIDGHEIKEVLLGRKPNQYVHDQHIISIIGLALYLGFASRTSLYEYAKKSDEYHDVVAYGKSMVAIHYEGLLQSGVSPSGMIFMLANIDGMVMQQDIGLEMQKPIQKITFTRKTINNNIEVKTAERLRTSSTQEQVITIEPTKRKSISQKRSSVHKEPDAVDFNSILGFDNLD